MSRWREVIAAALAVLLAVEPAAAHHVMGGEMPTTFAQGLLSGLGHPVLGLDHLAAVIAVGCLAAMQPKGVLLVVGYVVAMIVGAAAHVGEASVAGAEIFVACSVLALGLVLFLKRPLRADIAFALFAFAGLVNGYVLGETIAGAERAPIAAYFIGLALIQSGVALGVMAAFRTIAARGAFEPLTSRLVGACVAGVGIVVLVQLLAAGA
jgi:urease accessory protein